jgi:CheY-like chemotaxis protein/signal transduction histidine kinase/HAMP domain-containing protein
VRGEILELKDTINTMVDQLNSFASEVTRVAREVGTEGKLGGQAQVRGVSGVWKDLTDNVNLLAGNLTTQVRNIAAVTTAVAKGDLTQKITVDVKGEILELKNTINTMVDQLNSFASEVTRVAREVGTEGKLGGQAQVRGVSGVWKDLTDNVNIMAANLTDQVRGIAKVVTAVANGNLRQRLTVEAKGEIAALAETINGMSDTLATFAQQVTTMAREVGVEGKLGGQASVPGAAGTWKDLTDNVNQLAANLTTQVRAIADVATAVTKGDLTRSIKVEARGEVAELKDNINEMIRNLQETTQKNSEQDWLKTNLAKFTRLLQGQRNLLAVSGMILSELAPLVSVQHGVFYIMENPDADGASMLKMAASYAYKERKNLANQFKVGEGLVGQCAYEKQPIFLSNVPTDYVQISSGLGEANPLNIAVLPVLFEGRVLAAFELASFDRFSATHRAFLEQLTESIGIVLNTIQANMRTEALLKQSQSLAQELQSQQEELRQTNEQLEEKARLLSEQKAEVERKSIEVEQGKRALEEKAEQLALTSKYKSQFLSNMSHELRTPLNSLLILSQQLAENPDQNLTEKQVEFSRTIQSSGNDLLALINDILDLSKIESGTVTLEISEVSFATVANDMQRLFRHMAEAKGLEFTVEVAPDLPQGIHTDSKRLEQVLKNLLSNAFKFTERGRVALSMAAATGGWGRDRERLNSASSVNAFVVADTGIGIPEDKQRIIFEAFQQADGSTSRKYGGTGLGLSISREIANLLGGDISVVSVLGEGSTFTFYLPIDDPGVLQPRPHESGKTPGGGRSKGGAKRIVEALPDSYASQAALIDAPKPGAIAEVSDDRERIDPGDRVLLIVEDDPNFAKALLGIAKGKGFKGIVATTGNGALSMARWYQPSAITLDLALPDVDGLAVLERLKLDPMTRHIPAHVITVQEEREQALRRGALGFSIKPVSKDALEQSLDNINDFISRPKSLLIVDDNPVERQHIVDLVGGPDVEPLVASSGDEALAALKSHRFDCVVLDLGLPRVSGFEVLEAMQKEPKLRDLPVIVYTGRDLTDNEVAGIRKTARAIIVKDPRSHRSLIQQTALFLHRKPADTPMLSHELLEGSRTVESGLASKKLLVVDDDVRNIFALSAALERYNVKVISAENGKAALEVLEKTSDVQAVLMDVMMPEMDGYSTMKAIRKIPRLASLPIIAVTARAMKGDREKCIEAGASDYITKPVDIEQLLLLLRLWLYDPKSREEYERAEPGAARREGEHLTS